MRPVARRERGIEAAAFASFTQMSLHFSHRDRHADVGVAERLPRRPDTLRPCFQTTGGEQNIRGYGDIGGTDAFGNPVVGCVRAFLDNDEFDQRARVNPHPAVRHHMHGEVVSRGDAHHFCFHRAGVRVDVDLHRASSFQAPQRSTRTRDRFIHEVSLSEP